MTFKKPDLSAPRFRKKTTITLKKELYKAFLKKHPEHKELEYSAFKRIVTEYNGQIWQGAIDNRDGVQFPENLGYLLITKCNKPEGDNIDYLASVKYGKKVNYANWDSDNYLAKICYSNYSLKYRFKNRELWAFNPVKQFKHNVAISFPELYNRYIHLTGTMKIAKLYQNK